MNQAIKTLEALYNFKVERRVHNGYTEWEKAKDKYPLKQIFYKWQYIYSSDKGKISLIKLMDDYHDNYPWEIYGLDGNIFEDTERFKTKSKAVKKIRELLLDEK